MIAFVKLVVLMAAVAGGNFEMVGLTRLQMALIQLVDFGYYKPS